MGIVQFSPRIGSFIARAAFVLPALVAPASGIASLSACSGTVEGPCQTMGQRVCERKAVDIQINDDREVAYTSDEKNYLRARTLEIINTLPSCFFEGIDSIVFLNHIALPYPTSDEAAGAHVCETTQYSNGGSSANCHIEISTSWMDREGDALVKGKPHFWEFTFVHEDIHEVTRNLDKTCNNDGYRNITFDQNGNPTSTDDKDYINQDSYFPKFHLDQSKQKPDEDLANGGASYFLDGNAFLKWTEASKFLAQKYSVLKSFYYNNKEFLSSDGESSQPMSLKFGDKARSRCVVYQQGNKTISAMMVDGYTDQNK